MQMHQAINALVQLANRSCETDVDITATCCTFIIEPAVGAIAMLEDQRCLGLARRNIGPVKQARTPAPAAGSSSDLSLMAWVMSTAPGSCDGPNRATERSHMPHAWQRGAGMHECPQCIAISLDAHLVLKNVPSVPPDNSSPAAFTIARSRQGLQPFDNAEGCCMP